VVSVAPHAGAWIETSRSNWFSQFGWSRPTRARGLKPGRLNALTWQAYVAPHAGAWIETLEDHLKRGTYRKSRPTRARGLKLYIPYPIIINGMSRPTRARGLKPEPQLQHNRNRSVAPHAGAWIETIDCTGDAVVGDGRAPRGRVD